MEVAQLLQEIEKIEPSIAKKYEPLIEATDLLTEKLDGQEKTITEVKQQNDEFKEAITAMEKNIEDLKALVKAANDSVHSGGLYTGVWANLEQAKQVGMFVIGTLCRKSPKREHCLNYLSSKGITIGGEPFADFVPKAMSGLVTSTGAALVPDQFVQSLIVLMETYGAFRRNARNVPMESDTAIWPKLDTDITTDVVGQGGTITAADPALSNVRLIAEKFAGLTKISTELTEDSAIAVGELVGTSMARSIAKMEDQAGFLGDGTGTYWGFTGITGAAQRLASWNSQADNAVLGGWVTGHGHLWTDLTIANFEQVAGTLPQQFDDGAKWYVHKMFYYTVMVKLALAAGGTTPADYYRAQDKQFLGYPVEFVNVMPKATAVSQVCAILGDLFMGTFFGNRRALQIDTDNSVYFASDQVGVRGTERIAINVFGEGDVTNASAICGLLTAND